MGMSSEQHLSAMKRNNRTLGWCLVLVLSFGSFFCYLGCRYSIVWPFVSFHLMVCPVVFLLLRSNHKHSECIRQTNASEMERLERLIHDPEIF